MWVAKSILPRKFLFRIARPDKMTRESPLDPLNEILGREVQSTLINLLHYADRASMAFSLESRMPFMDYRIVEFLASIPFRYKLHNGWTKYVARKAMQGLLPSDIVWRRDKMGWPIPEDYWFRGPLKEWFCNIIESSMFLQKLDVGYDVRKRIESKEPIQMLIRFLNLALWHEIYFHKRDSFLT